MAGNYFGISLSNLRIEELARDVEASLQHHRMLSAPVSGALGSLRERSQFFFSLLPPGEGRFAFDARREFLEENGDEFLAFHQALTRLAGELENLPQKPEEVFNFVRRAQEIQVQLGFALESDDRNTVFWIERRGGGGVSREGNGVSRAGSKQSGKGALRSEGAARGRTNVFLQATPIDVAPILRECLWSKIDFDYETQALFYVPADLPDPRTPQFLPLAAERVRKLLEITRGRAFVLFTSYAQMNEMYQRLLGVLEFPLLKQGDAPKSALLEEFRLTPNAVLCATSSFWQGVDVQGEQLSCVIIDRLPFAVPGDPVVAARVKAIDANGGNAFFQYQVPSAVITLKQGFGRLIRSLHDRGLLVLLDNRILKKQYGRVFVESLPNYKKTTEMQVVESWFGGSTD